MKKVIAFTISLLFIFTLTGCDNAKTNQLLVYSFSGENENFSIENGTIVLSDSENIFYGGNLKVVQSEYTKDIESYRAAFYTLTDGEQETIYVDEFYNNSPAELTAVDLGKMVSAGSDIRMQFENLSESQGKFYCQLNITDADGNENSYTIELTLTEITA